MISDERSQKITENLGLVHSVAKRFRNRGADYEDLFQAGCIGLIKAVDNFDESYGTMFSTYAVPVIMGEIKRIFRDGGEIKISRIIKEKANYVQLKKDEFEKKNMREPTLSELSAICGVDIYELGEILAAMQPVISLSSFYEEDSEEYDVPVDNNESTFNKIMLSCVLNELEAKDRKIIYYRYYEGKTQAETAAIIGVSQVQVSRLEKRILKRIKRKLE